MRLRGKTVIVTGASSGIGLETAREFARAGCNVVLASRNEAALRALGDALAKHPGTRFPMPADVSDRDQVEAMVQTAAREFGSVDVLVNNAGVGLNATVGEGSLENMRYLFDVNFFGMIYAIQAVLPHMRRQGGGAIINVSSVAARIATPYNAAYCATKAAINAMTDALRLELGPEGITVAAVYPGFTATRFHLNCIREVEMPRRSRLLRGTPASAVGRKIVHIARSGSRDGYVTVGDTAAVTLRNFSPRLVDWGVRKLWLGARRPRPVRES